VTEQSKDDVMKEVFNHAAEMMSNGAANEKIKSDLMERGLNAEVAETVVSSLVGAHRDAKQEQGKKNMLYGALWCVGGTAITIGTYAAASGGGTYVVTYGAIVIGAFQFFQGIYQYATA
jgi:hypothetical protein